MDNCVFYNLKGEKISREQFVKLYSEIYYYLNDYEKEAEIDRIYQRRTSISGDDLIRFLKWKVGDKNTDYNDLKVIITQYGSAIDAEKIGSLANRIDDLWKNKCTKELYQKIIDEGINNVGAVYTLAMISIITRGREPIYDKFAEVALDAIMIGNHSFRHFMKYKELPDKTDTDAVLKRYEEYKWKLKTVFDEKWQVDKYGRDVDRALWTYGHLFR